MYTTVWSLVILSEEHWKCCECHVTKRLGLFREEIVSGLGPKENDASSIQQSAWVWGKFLWDRRDFFARLGPQFLVSSRYSSMAELGLTMAWNILAVDNIEKSHQGLHLLRGL